MIRILFIAISLIGLIILASCSGNSNSGTEAISADSNAIKIPEELAKLNAELLANPNNPDLYHKRANYYLEHKDLQNGFADMTRTLNIDSSKAEYYMTLSDIYFTSNKSRNAKAALEKSITLDDKNVEAILKLAELYLYVQQNDKSIEYINKALKIDQYNAKTYFMKGMNYKDLKDTAKAISNMQTAVEQDQSYYNAYMILGTLTAAQKSKLAVDYYKNAIRIQPQSTEAWYGIGKYYQDVKDWNNSIEAYTTLLKFDNDKYTMHNLGVVYLIGLKNTDKAIEYFTGAINTDPEYIEAYFGRGLSYQTKGDLKKAVADYNTCLTLNPQYQPAQAALQKLEKN